MTPQYKYSVIRAREAVLKENLFQVRDAINKYFYDRKKYPAGLEDLVSARYLRDVPVDPVLRKKEWRLVLAEPQEGEEFDAEEAQGIVDVKSLAPGNGLDGSAYADW